MLTDGEKRVAQALINVFETGSARGNYGDVTLIDGDSGHLTYGRSQTTLASGGLYELVRRYCAEPDARYAANLAPYLERLEKKDLSLDHDEAFRQFLRRAGTDPMMEHVQDVFFDERYWDRAVAAAEEIGLTLPLCIAVVYDGHVHGSWKAMRDRTTARHGNVVQLGEKAWIAHYITERRDWFEHNANPILHKSVRRMDAFKELIAADRWQLELPFVFRGVAIDEVSVGLIEAPPRELRRGMRGADVSALQAALETAGYEVGIDGDFGPKTEAGLQAFQSDQGLVVTGILDEATRTALGL